MKACLSLALFVLLLATDARAQQVLLQVERGPYYVGTPITVEIVAEGFDRLPEPSADATTPANGRITFLGVSSSQDTFVIINGVGQQSSSVSKLIYRYQYVAAQPGRVEIGPFTIQQAGTRRSSSSVAIDVRDVPLSDRIQIRLDPGVQSTYVGAQLRALLEYRIERELQRNLVASMLQAPALDQREAFRIEADPAAAGGQSVEIATAGGPLELRAQVREEKVGGEPYLVVSMPYLMVPLKTGRFDLGSASFTVDEGVTFTRDMFGGRRALQVRKLRAVDEPRTLLVKPVPSVGRPASFAGAVGRGFSLEVSADRSVVRVGDPIALRMVLRGDGPLEAAVFPRLDAEGLLPAQDFAVAAEPPSGELREGAKTFSTAIRVKRADVREIPALAYTFFDPATERFETVRSLPIALSVGAADVVGPSQVVRSDAPGTVPASAAPSETPRARGFALEGADLSIVREPRALLGTPGQLFGGWVAWLLYAGGGGLLLAAWLDRRRRSVDPEQLERLRSQRELLGRARAAADREDRDALRELAQCLRALHVLRPERAPAALDEFLRACDAQLFAPPAAAPAGAAAELCRRGLTLAEALAAEDA